MCTLYIRENISDFKVIKLKFPQFLNRKDFRLTVDNPEDLVVCRKIYNEFKHFSPMIPLSKIVSYLDKNFELIELIKPFVDKGYSTMYVWNDKNGNRKQF